VLEGTVCLVQTVCDVAETKHAEKSIIKMAATKQLQTVFRVNLWFRPGQFMFSPAIFF
jgi:hypothetical protein